MIGEPLLTKNHKMKIQEENNTQKVPYNIPDVA